MSKASLKAKLRASSKRSGGAVSVSAPATSDRKARLAAKLSGGGAKGGARSKLRQALTRPATGSRTGLQRTWMNGDVATTLMGLGISMPAWRGEYEVYRKIRSNPTVAMARAAALSPIKFADWSLEGEGVPPEILTELDQDVRAMWRHFIKHTLSAVDYGWQPFEKVWSYSQGRMKLELKPLCHDITEVLVFENGQVELRQDKAKLPPDKNYIFTYDDEYDGVFGRSRHENIRESAWAPWKTVTDQMHRYFEKAAGIIPMLNYPMGESTDASGTKLNNFDIAKKVLDAIRAGKAIAMPWMLQPWAEEAMTKGLDFSEILSWRISFLDVPSGHGSDYLGAAKYYDSLMCRGWLVPERAVIEGQHGTKAEAGEHADVALMVSEDLFTDICDSANKDWLPELVTVNYGAQYKDIIRIKPAPLRMEEKRLAKEIVTAVLTNPGNIDMLMTMLDFDAMVNQLGLPPGEGTPPDQVATELATKLKSGLLKTKLKKGLGLFKPEGADKDVTSKLKETLNG